MNINEINNKILTLNEEIFQLPIWMLVQDEIKSGIKHIIDNIIVLGPLFRDSFLAGYKYEHAKRIVQGIACPPQVNSAIISLPEESFQCSLSPIRQIFGLYDWTVPKDADVQICIFLCNRIDDLEEIGMFGSTKSTNADKMEQAKKFSMNLKNILSQNKKIKDMKNS